ncbi:MAG TPA: aquaporin [Anaeromyxobacteraceae bacterium]|nr:aquaporin [Anaeromyxobacteraceae bacterium]
MSRSGPSSAALRALPLYGAELVGTALLVAVGCSLAILGAGAGSPALALLRGAATRRAVTGFCFGSVGALLALSPVGKLSGAHLNPVVTLTFWLEDRMAGSVALGYALAQLAGGVLGALPLRLWGALGASAAFGATAPGPEGPALAALGEAVATFALLALLLLFLGHPRLRGLTPFIFPPLYAFLVWWEAPLSGTSTNPARSLGPGLVAGELRSFWVYLLGPLAGTLAVAALRRGWPLAGRLEVRVAKVFHFTHDAYGIFTEKSSPSHRAASGQ